jgi:hypothetical protein
MKLCLNRLYPIDKTRTNEFGESFTESEIKEKSKDE